MAAGQSINLQLNQHDRRQARSPFDLYRFEGRCLPQAAVVRRFFDCFFPRYFSYLYETPAALGLWSLLKSWFANCLSLLSTAVGGKRPSERG